MPLVDKDPYQIVKPSFAASPPIMRQTKFSSFGTSIIDNQDATGIYGHPRYQENRYEGNFKDAQKQPVVIGSIVRVRSREGYDPSFSKPTVP
jgi:hypothetical protein